MNVLEMHLAIQQGVDKINSLQADMLLQEEIDLELNKAQIKFINTKYGRNNALGKGFEQSQKRIDDLRTLVTEYENPVTYKDQLSADFWIDTFKLPIDYMYLVSQRSDVKINNCERVSWDLRNNQPLNYFTISLNDFVCNNANNGSTDFVDSIRMMADPDNPLLGDQLIWSGGSGFTYPADTENVRLSILGITVPGINVYWEQYGELTVPGNFIFEVDATTLFPWFNWDMSVTNLTSGSNLATSFIGRDATNNTIVSASAQYEDSTYGNKRDIIGGTTISAVNKFVQHDDIFTLLNDPFNTTKYTSPLTTIRGSYIDIYTSAIFIIDKLKITYIRKPANISLNLSIDCELPEHCHQEIVDMTVSSILEGISDPRYKSQSVEAGKNE
tara:strand:- start:231 stop:1388 length:1158 start_codon:yes stop_codon:yes gene_type:complete